MGNDSVQEERAQGFTYDKTENGWELLEDVELEPDISSFEDMELVFPFKGEEFCLSGEDFIQRARNEIGVNLGQRHAEYLLRHQKEIPKEWRGHCLVFPGTIWRVRVGHCEVPCLDWDNCYWCLNFIWMGGGFDFRYRLVHLRE